MGQWMSSDSERSSPTMQLPIQETGYNMPVQADVRPTGFTNALPRENASYSLAAKPSEAEGRERLGWSAIGFENISNRAAGVHILDDVSERYATGSINCASLSYTPSASDSFSEDVRNSSDTTSCGDHWALYVFKWLGNICRGLEDIITTRKNTQHQTVALERRKGCCDTSLDPSICKGCHSKIIGVTQVPCGHIVCRECSPSEGDRTCRVCDTKVEDVVAYDGFYMKSFSRRV